MGKTRLDALLVAQGIAETRQRAKALTMAGLILVNEQKITKAGQMVDSLAVLRRLGNDCPFVSRGGLKLSGALDVFPIQTAGAIGLDVGSSTGGFTDCLLQRGADHVTCVDVGRGQIHSRLRQDPRIRLVEGFNARFLDTADFADRPYTIVVMDLSFISLRLIFPPLVLFLHRASTPHADIVALIKPQFEAGRDSVGKGGIVRDAEVQQRVRDEIQQAATDCNLQYLNQVPASIQGADGNQEWLMHLRYSRATI